MADHCWHGKGIVLTSNPPKYPQVCCNCGAGRHQTSHVTYEPGHGPHAGRVEYHEASYYYLDERGEQPCVPTP